uniref:Uncharacterized protein n=1 Tax=Anguilla anguilla TaxID=7936 RepID=A0A0E9V185_ANGAN
MYITLLIIQSFCEFQCKGCRIFFYFLKGKIKTSHYIL